MKTRPVICNKCAHEFKIKKIKKKIVQDGLEGRVTINYFTCPKCTKKYTSFVSNDELQHLIKEKTKAYADIQKVVHEGPEAVEKAFDKYNDLDKKVKSVHNRLMMKFKA